MYASAAKITSNRVNTSIVFIITTPPFHPDINRMSFCTRGNRKITPDSFPIRLWRYYNRLWCSSQLQAVKFCNLLQSLSNFLVHSQSMASYSPHCMPELTYHLHGDSHFLPFLPDTFENIRPLPLLWVWPYNRIVPLFMPFHENIG